MTKTFEERYKDETFTDNTQISYCEECETCRFWGDEMTAYENEPTKASCYKYPFPERKPDWVINNYGECDYYEPRDETV